MKMSTKFIKVEEMDEIELFDYTQNKENKTIYVAKFFFFNVLTSQKKNSNSDWRNTWR